MSLPTVSPTEARRMLDQGAILVDIREADEHARERIASARHLPLSKLDEANLALHEGKPIIFHCRSGARTLGNAPLLAQKAGACEAMVIEGGLEAWKKGGPARRDGSAPADRAAASGADRCRQPDVPRHDAWPVRLFLVLRRPRSRGGWPDAGGYNRFLRHGSRSHARALELGDLRQSGQSNLRLGTHDRVQS